MPDALMVMTGRGQRVHKDRAELAMCDAMIDRYIVRQVRDDEMSGGQRLLARKRLNWRKEKETMRAEVNLDVCIGSAMCVATAPEVFELGDDGLARAVNPDPADDQLLREAAEGCPVQAITLEDDDGNQVYP